MNKEKKITYVYKLVKGGVIVHYVDEERTLIAQKKSSVKYFDENDAPETGEVVEKTTEVTYVYKLVKGDVIVHYVDEEGNTIKARCNRYTISHLQEQYYDTTDNKPKVIKFDGKEYELVPSKRQLEKKMVKLLKVQRM